MASPEKHLPATPEEARQEFKKQTRLDPLTHPACLVISSVLREEAAASVVAKTSWLASKLVEDFASAQLTDSERRVLERAADVPADNLYFLLNELYAASKMMSRFLEVEAECKVYRGQPPNSSVVKSQDDGPVLSRPSGAPPDLLETLLALVVVHLWNRNPNLPHLGPVRVALLAMCLGLFKRDATSEGEMDQLGRTPNQAAWQKETKAWANRIEEAGKKKRSRIRPEFRPSFDAIARYFREDPNFAHRERFFEPNDDGIGDAARRKASSTGRPAVVVGPGGPLHIVRRLSASIDTATEHEPARMDGPPSATDDDRSEPKKPK